MSVLPLPQLAAYAALGAALGWIHFGLLHWNTRLYLAGRRLAPVLQLLRVVAAAAVFVPLARIGPWPLLSAMAGFLVGRGLVIRRVRAP